MSDLFFGRSFDGYVMWDFHAGFLSAADVLKDGPLAVAKAVSDRKNIQFGDSPLFAEADNGSRAVQKLRKFNATSLSDAQLALSLSLLLVTYNDVKIGAPLLPIVRSALLQAMPWKPELMCPITGQIDPYFVCTLPLETFDCIILGEALVLRADTTSSKPIIYHHYGIAYELLPYMYDVCVLYRDIKNRTVFEVDKNRRINRLLSNVATWNPDLVMLQRKHLVPDEAERALFLRHAKVFKSMVQLLLLQARQDPLTDALVSSRAVQRQAMIMQAAQKEPNKPLFLIFPYIISCTEYTSSDKATCDRILNVMNALSNNIASTQFQSMLACLMQIWETRRWKPESCWFECFDREFFFTKRSQMCD